MGTTEPTRQRLLSAAMEFFEARGFRGTTVGDIEAAVGLTARGGAFYRHFKSKRAVLEEALDVQLRDISLAEDVIDLLPLGDERAELTLLGRLFLKELDRERTVIRILEREGNEFPELTSQFCSAVQGAYKMIAALIAQRLPDMDSDAVTSSAIGALVNHRRMAWTFGETPLGLDDKRFLETWVEVWLRVAARGA